MPETTPPLDGLPSLNRGELLALWTKLFGQPLAFRASKDFLVCALAYRLQEQSHGGLSKRSQAHLRRLARELEDGVALTPTKTLALKPGTRLVREWRSVTHEVRVLNTGFKYRNRSYQSLSEIAREITGTRWSGPRFFGLNGSRVQSRGVSHVC
ncbi:MAG: DUF2924 domain-containing protein [Gammaproteobacteria bacterium]